jgi:Leucine-rich repeat (LRR) protein
MNTLRCSANKIAVLPEFPSELTYLNCSNNRLTSLPILNDKLEFLCCSNNQLTSLPSFNSGLKTMWCCNNMLTSLPILNPDLRELHCSNNQLTFLLPLNPNLLWLYIVKNPIYDIIVGSKLPSDVLLMEITRNRIQTLYNLKYLYYSLKFKHRLREWLWVKVREPKIQEYYSPANLQKLLSGIDEQDFERFDAALSSW